MSSVARCISGTRVIPVLSLSPSPSSLSLLSTPSTSSKPFCTTLLFTARTRQQHRQRRQLITASPKDKRASVNEGDGTSVSSNSKTFSFASSSAKFRHDASGQKRYLRKGLPLAPSPSPPSAFVSQVQQQRRWAQVHDVKFENGRSGYDGAVNRAHKKKAGETVMDRYREKLEGKAKEKGLNDITDLRKAYKAQIERVRKEASSIGPAIAEPLTPPSAPSSSSSTSSTRDASTSTSSSPSQAGSTFSAPVPYKGLKTLSSYLDVARTRALPHKEIEALWRLRHARDPQSLVAVMTAAKYARMEQLAKRFPRFVLPIPRQPQEQDEQQQRQQNQVDSMAEKGGQGQTAAEIHFLEWTFPAPQTTAVLFTSLAEYKLRGEFAVPHTTATMHSELAAEMQQEQVQVQVQKQQQGPVLLHGTVMKDRGVTVDDARWLLMCVQRFYGGGSSIGENASSETESRDLKMSDNDMEIRLLEQFTRGDAAFDVQEVLERVQKVDARWG